MGISSCYLEDTDSAYKAYKIPETSSTLAKPWDQQNMIIGIGSHVEFLLANQIKDNYNPRRFFRVMLPRTASNAIGAKLLVTKQLIVLTRKCQDASSAAKMVINARVV